jgi:glycosyltransferase involved in cell wall biosynthesis
MQRVEMCKPPLPPGAAGSRLKLFAMNQRLAKVAIGLPVYNGQRYVADAIESMRAQTLTDWVMVICDNASTDATAEICKRYAAIDPRILYTRNDKNIGATPNFNLAQDKAHALGTYFKWIAADDRYEPTFLEKCVAALDADPTVVNAFAKTRLIDQDGKTIPEDPDAPVAGTTSKSVVRRFAASLDEVFCFPEFGVHRPEALRACVQQSYYGSDKVMLAEESLRGRFYRVDERLFLRRCHEESSMSSSSSSKKRSMWALGLSKAPLIPPQLRMYFGYSRAVWRVKLPLWPKLACFALALGMALRVDKWRKLVVPGPYNYLGLQSSRPHRESVI